MRKEKWENIAPDRPEDLVDFGGKGNYSTSEFTWKNRYGPTAIKFLDSDKSGKKYMNDMFVGDVRNGNLYRFELNEERTQLLLDGVLQDKIADYYGDLEVGPDGSLYIVSGIWNNEGKIFRLVPMQPS
jgi:glucose/arabinose dehydrogenase